MLSDNFLLNKKLTKLVNYNNLGLAYVITHGQDEEEEAAADE